jgi:hypothetical protein
VSFFSATSTAKPTETLTYLTNLDAWELASEIDLPYKGQGTRFVDLNEQLGLHQNLSQ